MAITMLTDNSELIQMEEEEEEEDETAWDQRSNRFSVSIAEVYNRQEKETG